MAICRFTFNCGRYGRPHAGCMDVFTGKGFYRRVAVKSSSSKILVEKSRVVMIFSVKDGP